MIIVDTALRAREAEGRPIRVGMIGAGFMGRGVVNQIVNHVPGMRMSAIYARRPEQAVDAYAYAGLPGARAREGNQDVADACVVPRAPGDGACPGRTTPSPYGKFMNVRSLSRDRRFSRPPPVSAASSAGSDFAPRAFHQAGRAARNAARR